jgi:hypothetical protein
VNSRNCAGLHYELISPSICYFCSVRSRCSHQHFFLRHAIFIRVSEWQTKFHTRAGQPVTLHNNFTFWERRKEDKSFWTEWKDSDYVLNLVLFNFITATISINMYFFPFNCFTQSLKFILYRECNRIRYTTLNIYCDQTNSNITTQFLTEKLLTLFFTSVQYGCHWLCGSTIF